MAQGALTKFVVRGIPYYSNLKVAKKKLLFVEYRSRSRSIDLDSGSSRLRFQSSVFGSVLTEHSTLKNEHTTIAAYFLNFL